MPALRDDGPAAVHDLHPGTGPPGGRHIRVPGMRAADGRVRRAAVLSGPGRAGPVMSDGNARLPRPALRLARDEPNQVPRLLAFRAAHPHVIIGAGEFGVQELPGDGQPDHEM